MPYARKDTLIWQRGMYYHIYNHGARQVTIFREPTNYLFTIAKLKKYSQAKGISILAYCLMPNHYHLLIKQDGEEAAGKSHSDEPPFAALGRYLHSNPVKDGMLSEHRDCTLCSADCSGGDFRRAWLRLCKREL